MIDRNYILNLMKSRDMTIEEFNYEKLSAPPIKYYFSDFDIYRLYEIATSLRYSAKPQVKYQEIDRIMKSRGFVKLSAGTNRVVYRCIENDTFVAKVAYDSVALQDNPKEFINQNYLKPFCAKIFEVAGNGVIAFAERVNPITNREEFLSVAEDIFELLTEFIIGEYVVDDMGTKYFMNYGMRTGWGPVILDFSTLYKLDGNKLYCNRPEPTSDTGICGGEIDYDAGYNNLVCTKCGKIYRAKELELKVKNNEIVTKSVKGEFNKMKVRISGGSKNCDVTTIIKTTSVEEAKVEESVNLVDASAPVEKKRTVKVSLGHNDDQKVERIVKTPQVKVHKAEETKEEAAVETLSVNGSDDIFTTTTVDLKEAIKTPIKFGAEPTSTKSDEEVIRDSFGDIAKLISKNQIQNLLDADKVETTLKGIKFVVDTLRDSSIWDTSLEKKLYDIVIDSEHVDVIMDQFEDAENKLNVSANVVNAKNANEIFESYVYVVERDEKEVAEETIEVDVKAAEEMASVEAKVEAGEITSDEEYTVIHDFDEPIDDVAAGEIQLAGFDAFSARIIDISTKFPNMESKNVLVVDDGNGGFITLGEEQNTLFVIDRINGIDTEEAEVVSKSFVENLLKEAKDNSTELTKDTFKKVETTDPGTVNGVPEEAE